MIIKLESDYWDCEYSIFDLIKYNENKCLIDVNYRKHKSDSCFGGFALLFKSPKRNDNTYLEIPIREDGFVYTGDVLVRNLKDYKETDTESAISFMFKYKNMINSIKEFEYDLGKIVKNNECINILYEDNYSKGNSQVVEFKIKE